MITWTTNVSRRSTGAAIGELADNSLGYLTTLIFVGTALVLTTPGQAKASATDLADLSLEQLGNIVVTSVSRREEPLVDAAASIFVISADDIRRAGATSLPDALRLAPNLQVARADGNQYAISARGFNNVLANKLLVLIDGRTVYTPLFSGVFWEAQRVMLEDVDRIEVISGPGATLWGANAVNGVINIITRSSSDTQGTLISAAAGTEESSEGARYGSTLGENGHLRVYAQHYRRDEMTLNNGNPNHDAGRGEQGGFRADVDRANDSFTIQGDAYDADLDQVPSGRQISGANVLARWTRQLDGGSEIHLQTYYDHTQRDQPGFAERLDTMDVELQHSFSPLAGHAAMWGGGYRSAHDQVRNGASQAFLPTNIRQRWSNVFIQDTMTLSSHFDITAGVKAESNDYTGYEYLPNLRLRWLPTTESVVWAALSRAARAPSRVDRDYYVPGNPPYLITGNSDFQSEIAQVAELGYRAQLLPSWSYSVTAFYTDYDKLRSVEPNAGGGLVFGNKISGNNTGIEMWSTYNVTSNWRLVAGLVTQRERFKPDDDSHDQGGLATLGNDPHTWWSLRSSLDITSKYSMDVALRHVGSLPNPSVPAYTAVDLNLRWKPQRNLEISLAVDNLFDPAHVEWGSPIARVEYDRTATLKLVWQLP